MYIYIYIYLYIYIYIYWAQGFIGPCWARALGPFICWALLGPFICWALLGPGPVGPIHLLGPVGAIHLLGPVGPGPWAHSFVFVLSASYQPNIQLSVLFLFYRPVITQHSVIGQIFLLKYSQFDRKFPKINYYIPYISLYIPYIYIYIY